LKLKLEISLWITFVIGVIIISGFITSILLSQQLTSYEIQRARDITAEHLRFEASQHLNPEDFIPENFDEKDKMFTEFFKTVSTPEIIRIKVWSMDGTIIYSDNKGIVGKNFYDNPTFQKAITGETVIEIKEPVKPDNIGELGYEQLMEVYIPISLSSDEIDGVIEIYTRLDFVNAAIAQANLILFSTISVATLIIVIVVFFLYILLSQNVVKPIMMLKNTSDKVRRGNLNTRAELNGSDDIANLSKSFNSMIDAINKNINLEKKLVDIQEHIGEQKLEDMKNLDVQKDMFTSMMAHELKTPLTPILGWLNVLKKGQILGTVSPEQSHAIDKILSNTHKLTRLINDLLDAQKLDLHELKFNYDDTNIRDLMNDVYNDIRHLTDQKKIQLRNSTKQNIVIKSDKYRIDQVLNNLIYNASDFVPKDTGRIEINAQMDNSEVLFSVKDNGSGIPPDEQKNLFKKFYQLDTSPTRKHGGSGLGLSICRGIIEGLGGRIWVESKVGEGATFYFVLPKERNS